MVFSQAFQNLLYTGYNQFKMWLHAFSPELKTLNILHLFLGLCTGYLLQKRINFKIQLFVNKALNGLVLQYIFRPWFSWGCTLLLLLIVGLCICIDRLNVFFMNIGIPKGSSKRVSSSTWCGVGLEVPQISSSLINTSESRLVQYPGPS